MKFFILTAVLAACTASSLVTLQNFFLQWQYLIEKCLLRLASSWAHRQPTIAALAPAPTTVWITHPAHLTAVMARGTYNIGIRFHITCIVNTLHNDSNIFGCNCDGGCRAPKVQSKEQSLETFKSNLCVESSFVIQWRSLLFQGGRWSQVGDCSQVYRLN